MSLVTTDVPYSNGKFHMFLGPVHSGKVGMLAGLLDGAGDSGYLERNRISFDDRFLIVRHPTDSENPRKLGKHDVHLVTENPDEIANIVKDSTRCVVIEGIAHFKNSGIVNLVDALVRSDRNVVSSALNLKADGTLPNHLGGLLGIVDQLELTRTYCQVRDCDSQEAARSMEHKNGHFYPVCVPHFAYLRNPPGGKRKLGKIEMYPGSVSSGKSSAAWRKADERIEQKGQVLNFKPKDIVRYDETPAELFEIGTVRKHGGTHRDTVAVNIGMQIIEYIFTEGQVAPVEYRPKKWEKPTDVLIEEGQFFPDLIEACLKLSSMGINVIAPGLPRSFKRDAFGKYPDLMAFADRVDMSYATCVDCGHPATDNRRMIKGKNEVNRVAHISTPLVMPAGVDGRDPVSYNATCVRHFDLRGQDQKYVFNPFQR